MQNQYTFQAAPEVDDYPLRKTAGITVLLLVMAAAAALITGTGTVRDTSDKYLNETLQKATISFAGARAVNAIVSVAQKMEAGGSVKFLGTGGSAAISPFEWLDPLNDLVERFSLVMLASCVSIGIQMVLNEAMPWLSIWVLFPLAGGLLLGALILKCLPRTGGRRFFRAGVKTLAVTILLTAMVPCMAAVNHLTYNLFLDDTYQTAAATLKQQETRIDQPNDEQEGIMASLNSFKTQAQELKARAHQLVSHILDLIVVFIIQTIALPIAVLWVFIKLIQHTLGLKEPILFEAAFMKYPG
ncbi:MAG: hypothetical protein SWH61_14470 [Thermodesulfobacteriota bacterium]|nr:hypothetical protein [Thermodesulfobacteriota bacterium]